MGHFDLFGQGIEATLDYFVNPASLPVPCIDCAYLTITPSQARVGRGQQWEAPAVYFNLAIDRIGGAPSGYADEAGGRCAR